MSGRHTLPSGYVTVLRGDLGQELAELPTKRRHPVPELPPRRWAAPDAVLLARVLDALDRL